ncbi:MAG: hypothetical protein IPN76_26185 [Saprospiraceae bacterium]|nr:hypothetical protein [Saprospiraceae bacterium]
MTRHLQAPDSPRVNRERGKGRDGLFKSRAASMLHLGMADQRELCREFKINRNLLRHWLRWDYRQRVLKWTKPRALKVLQVSEYLQSGF